MARAESRRSSRNTETVTVATIHTRGTRSSTAVELQSQTSDEKDDMSTTAAKGSNRKRGREIGIEGATRSLSMDTTHSESQRKRIRRNQYNKGEEGRHEEDTESMSKTSSSDTSSVIEVAKTMQQEIQQKRAPPLMERMKVLSERYSSVATALLLSETQYLEDAVMRVTKGTCVELITATEPLKARHDERIRIAEHKLQLQKDQIDREWLAMRTQAHYDFVKQRADLRAHTRSLLSEEIYDISREYRVMCSESLGVLADQSPRPISHKAPTMTLEGASLTERDEDFLLLDIRPPTGMGTGADVYHIAPILNSLATSKKLGSIPGYERPRPRPSTSRPTAQSLQTLSAGVEELLAENSNLPGINSLLKKGKLKEKHRVRKLLATPSSAPYQRQILPLHDPWQPLRMPVKKDLTGASEADHRYGTPMGQSLFNSPSNLVVPLQMPQRQSSHPHSMPRAPHYEYPDLPGRPSGRPIEQQRSDPYRNMGFSRENSLQYAQQQPSPQQLERLPSMTSNLPYNTVTSPQQHTQPVLNHSLFHPFKRAEMTRHDHDRKLMPAPVLPSILWGDSRPQH